MKYFFILQLLFPVLSFAHNCLSYSEGVLTGRLKSVTYPGRPNYESIEAGDEEETYFILVLPRPVCILEQKMEHYSEPAQRNISSVQLVLNGRSTYKSLRPFLGKTVICSGSFFSAQTAHHKTPLLMSETSCH